MSAAIMFMRSLPLFTSLTLCLGALLSATSPASGRPALNQSEFFKTQCLHPALGLTDCSVAIGSAGQGGKGSDRTLTIHWPNQQTTLIQIDQSTAKLRRTLQSSWQEASKVGICWGNECFETALSQLGRQLSDRQSQASAPVVAMCYHPLNGTTACQVDLSSSKDAIYVDRDYGETVTVNLSQRNQLASLDPSVSLQQPSLGVCVDGICAFGLKE